LRSRSDDFPGPRIVGFSREALVRGVSAFVCVIPLQSPVLADKVVEYLDEAKHRVRGGAQFRHFSNPLR
jgi:hypothetical protein